MSPSLGRFLSADSVQPNAPGTQGYDPYAYVANNPTTWTDPSGDFASNEATAAYFFAYQNLAAVAATACMTLPAAAIAATGGEAAFSYGVVAGNCLATVLLAQVVAPVLSCAFDIEDGCIWDAYEMSQMIKRLGAATGLGAVAWAAY